MEVPEKRYGHSAIRFQDYVVVWGGHNFQHFMEPREVYFYNIKTEKWLKKESAGKVPLCTSGSCVALLESCMYLFAGFGIYGATNSMFVLDLCTLKWTEPEILSKVPSQRDKLGCWVRDTKIIYFGGFGFQRTAENIQSGEFVFDDSNPFAWGGWNNDLLSFDTVNHTWEALPISATTPSPRAAHACTNISENEGYLFGGRHGGQRLNDLYSINLDTYEWMRIISSGIGPVGRTWHSLTPISRDHLFIFGGLSTDNKTLADCWIYDATENTWTEVKYERTEERRWHSACQGLYPGQVVVFGGTGRNYVEGAFLNPNEHLNDVRIFHVTPLPLKRLAIGAVVKFGHKCGSWDELPRELKSDITEILSGG